MYKEFLDMRYRIFSIIILLLILFFSVAPLQEQTVEFSKNTEGIVNNFIPQGYGKLLENWNFYIHSQWFGKNFGQMIPIIAILFTFPLFSREVEKNTIQFLLVRKKRDQVFRIKVFSSVLFFILFVLLMSLLPYIYTLFIGKDFDIMLTLKYMVTDIIGGFMWLGLGIFFSVIFSDQIKPLVSGLGIFALSTALGITLNISYLNPFEYLLGSNIILGGNIDWFYSIFSVLIGTALIFISHIIFIKKDY